MQGIAIDDDGKKLIVSLGGAALLADIVGRRDVTVSVLLYTCQTISNIACVPGAREVLCNERTLKSLSLFKQQTASPSLSRAAGVALDAIEWKP